MLLIKANPSAEAISLRDALKIGMTSSTAEALGVNSFDFIPAMDLALCAREHGILKITSKNRHFFFLHFTTFICPHPTPPDFLFLSLFLFTFL